MYLYHFCLAVTIFFAAVVIADLKNDLEQAEKCLNSHHIQQQETGRDIMECYKRHLGIDTGLKMQSSFEDIIKNACSIKDAKGCILEHTQVLRDTCFTAPFLKKEFDKNMRQFDAIFQYACNEGGKITIEFLNSGGIDCVKELFNEADNKAVTCLTTLLQSKMKELEAAEDNAEKYQEIQCSMTYQLKPCIIDRMTSCTKPRDILDGLFQELVNASDCSKYAPSSSGRIQVPYILMFLSSSLLVLLCLP